jgi:hypothetical protein
MTRIILLFHKVLSMPQSFPDKLAVQCLYLGAACGIADQWWWRPAIHNLKWSGLECRLEGGVITIFRPREPPQLTLRTITRQAAQINTQNVVSNLLLTVCLGMECRAHPKLSTRETEKLCPEGTSENRVSIADN